MSGLSKDQFDILKLVISTILGLILISIVVLSYFATVRDHLIEAEQKQLLTLSKTIAKSIERFFRNHEDSISILINNDLFREKFQYYKAEEDKFVHFDNVAKYYLTHKDSIAAIEIYNRDLSLIEKYPEEGEESRKIMMHDLKYLEKSRVSLISDIYKHHGKFYIDLYVPFITEESKFEAVVSVRISLEKIYEKYVKPIKAGEKGYASVKDQNGILIMHPKKEDIGIEVMQARKSEYPNYDWSELEAIVDLQKQGKSGVGTYHSIWYHDSKREHIKKINAYSPAVVGNKFWIINVSMDYLEMTEFLRESTVKSVIVACLIMLIFLLTMIYIYKIHKDKRQLVIEASYAKRLNALNKELEEDLAKMNKLQTSLQRTITKYEKLFNNASDCIFVMNVNDNLTPSTFYEVNKKAMCRLKYTREELFEMTYSNISKYISESHFANMIDHLLEKGNMIFEDVLLTKDSEEIPVEISAHLYDIFDEKKVLMISRDISLRKMQELALQRSQERFRLIVKMVADEIGIQDDIGLSINDDKEQFILELERINIELEKLFKKEVEENQRKEALMIYQSRFAAMGEMVANIAHQWRQPLSALSMILSNIHDAYKREEVTASYLNNKIARSQELINHMSSTIDDFRNFLNPQKQDVRFDLRELIEQTLRFVEDSIRLNDISVKVNVDENIYLKGYANEFLQVLFSLIQNAIDAIIEKDELGGVMIIESKVIRNMVHLHIKDNGIGIPKEIRDQVFNPYFTTKGNEKGTGLGLYMAKTVLEKSFNGAIELESTTTETIIIVKVPNGGV